MPLDYYERPVLVAFNGFTLFLGLIVFIGVILLGIVVRHLNEKEQRRQNELSFKQQHDYFQKIEEFRNDFQ